MTFVFSGTKVESAGLVALAEALPESVSELAVWAQAWEEPGEYDITNGAAVGEAPSTRSKIFCSLEKGTHVTVLEVVHMPAEQRVRGRIREPAGFISLRNTSSEFCWAEVRALNKTEFLEKCGGGSGMPPQPESEAQ